MKFSRIPNCRQLQLLQLAAGAAPRALIAYQWRYSIATEHLFFPSEIERAPGL